MNIKQALNMEAVNNKEQKFGENYTLDGDL